MKIGILTQNPSLYSVGRFIEEAHLRGHEVAEIIYPKCHVKLESDHPTVLYQGNEINDLDAVIPRIAPKLTNYGTAVLRQFEMMGVYTPNRSIAISRSRDKLRAAQILSKSKISVPKTIFAKESWDVEGLIEQIGGAPLVVKLVSGSQGNGVVLAETKKAAKSVIQAFYASGTSILVQEFIKESAGKDIRALVVGNKVVASMLRQSTDNDFRSNIHQGGVGTPIKLSDKDKKVAIHAAKAMGLPICGVDMIFSDRGLMVLEVNSSPGLEGIESVTKRNVAAKIIEYIEHNAKRNVRKDSIGA